MAGINQGTPETAIGEPIRLGSNDEFEIEQHPVSDRLIIRDTVNGKVAYVKREVGDTIGGDDIFVEALQQGKVLADDGQLYDRIQVAEGHASSWMFIPPGTYTESVMVETDNLTIQGSGYNTHIDGAVDLGHALQLAADNVTIQDLSVSTTGGNGFDDDAIHVEGDHTNGLIKNVTIRDCDRFAIRTDDANPEGWTLYNVEVEQADQHSLSWQADNLTVVGCTLGNVQETNNDTCFVGGSNSLFANNIVTPGPNGQRGVVVADGDSIAISNRIIGAGTYGIDVTSANNIVANNRVSDSGTSDIQDGGTGTILDANLTGVSN